LSFSVCCYKWTSSHQKWNGITIFLRLSVFDLRL